MNEPLDTAIIEQRLRDQVPDLQSVGGAADLGAITDIRGFRPGSAFVVLNEEVGIDDGRPSAQGRPSGRQAVAATIGVIVAARNYRDKTGVAAAADAGPLIGAIRTALLGDWIPGGQLQRPLKWVEGSVLKNDDSTLLWLDVFHTTYFMGGK